MGKSQLTTNTIELKTREDVVAEAIRASILRGTFSPGEKLDQQQIADDLGVSRSPVRGALRTLSAEGLVTIIANRGAIVAERSWQELEELYFIRGILEGAAAERSAPRLDEEALERLAAILEEAETTDDIEALLVLNHKFHLTVCSAIRQPILLDYIQELRNMVAPYNRLYLEMAGSKALAWADHRRIYEACVRADGEAARVETQRHLEQVYRRMAQDKRLVDSTGREQ